MGRFGEAQLECLKSLRKRPDDFQALHLLGLSFYLQGDLAAAAALIERALEMDPASAEAHANLGAVLKALKRLPEALQHYDTAVALDPGFANAHANRGNLLFSACCFAEAIASYDQVIALRPGHVAALTNRGCARMELR